MKLKYQMIPVNPYDVSWTVRSHAGSAPGVEEASGNKRVRLLFRTSTNCGKIISTSIRRFIPMVTPLPLSPRLNGKSRDQTLWWGTSLFILVDSMTSRVRSRYQILRLKITRYFRIYRVG